MRVGRDAGYGQGKEGKARAVMGCYIFIQGISGSMKSMKLRGVWDSLCDRFAVMAHLSS